MKERGVLLQPECAFFNDVMDVNDRNGYFTGVVCKAFDIIDDVLALGMRGSARIRKRSTLDDHVVLKILYDQSRLF